MATLTWRIVLLSVLCVPTDTKPPSPRDDLKAVLLALEKLVKYYERNYKYINLDGLFGLRVIEGQLQLLLSEHKAGGHKHLSHDVVNKISDLRLAAQNVSGISLEFVRTDDPEYFKDFSSLILYPWIFNKSSRKLEASLRWEIPQYKAKLKVKLTEELSDRCMIELMNRDNHGCEISDACVEIMTTRGLTGYGITHQILWSILGEIMPNCSAQMSRILSRYNMNISTFQLELCTNNFYEMVAVVQVLMHGKVHESHQDLFLEQQSVCPNLGFYEFMKKDYLDQILSWQFPSGCFGEQEGSQGVDEDLDLASLLEGYHDNSNTNMVPEVNKLEPANGGTQLKFSVANENLKYENSISKSSTSYPHARPNQPLLDGLKGSVLRFPRNAILNINSTEKHPRILLHDSTKHKLYYMNQKNNDKPEQIKKLESKNKNGLIIKSTSSPRSSFTIDEKIIQKHKVNQGSVGHSNSFLMNRRQKVHLGKVSKETKNAIGRHLLVEKMMEGGCLSHKTGVGSGALVMYLRYLIEPGNISWTGQHELFLSDSRNLLQAAGERPEVGARESPAEFGNEEEEEEEENIEEENGALNEAVNYSEGNDGEAGEDQGDDDYNEEKANNGGGDAGNAVNNVHDIDTIIINNEDAEKISEIYTDHNEKVGLDSPKKIVLERDDDVADQEEDHNYYDDEGETERGIIKRRKPPTSRPHPPVKTRRKHVERLVSKEPLYGQEPELLVHDQPNYSIIFFVSIAPFFILFFFLFKFIRKRKVHIRYYF